MHPRAVLLLSIVATAAFLVASLAAALTLLGHPARLVDVVGLFFGGLGSGASLVATVLTVRRGVGSKRFAVGKPAVGGNGTLPP